MAYTQDSRLGRNIDLAGFVRPSVCAMIVAATLWTLVHPVIADTQTPQRRYAMTVSGQTAQPAVAIENICAWPNLTKLPDGSITATVFNRPSHGLLLGDIEVWASTDQGATWQKRGTPVMHDADAAPNTRMNHAAGLAANGDLIVIGAGWSLEYKDPGNPDAGFNRGQRLRPWVSRSSDGGSTWQTDREAFPAVPPDQGGVYAPFGDIIRGRDGDLRVAAYSYSKENENERHSYVLRSRDDGRTWGEPVCIDPERSLNETFLIHLGEGRWLAAARDKLLYLYESSDDGITWQYRGPLTEQDEVPAHFLRLADGRLLLCYGHRVKEDEHVAARISDDEGRTWSEPIRLVDFIGWDGGYPSSVQLDSGEVVTAYYARKTTYCDGYHMGVVKWSPDASFAKRVQTQPQP